MDPAVPYSQRCYRTKSGTAIIWPFINVARGSKGHELLLDTNALNNVAWLGELPDELRLDSVVNPWMAIQEQWFSNPEFRKEPKTRIEGWTKNLAEYGVRFRPGYEKDQVALLKKNDLALRRQFSSIIPFVAVMRTLVSQRLPIDDALSRLVELSRLDIPRFTSAIALTALAVALKAKQSVKLADDSKTAYSYLESFLSFQPAKKDETDFMNVPYLRNRAGDLNMWMMLPVLGQLGYPIGRHSALATGDKALHRIILRAVPPYMATGGVTTMAVAIDELPPDIYQRICDVFENLQTREGATLDVQRARITTLFEVAKSWTKDPREQEALDEVFSQWWLPGHGLRFESL